MTKVLQSYKNAGWTYTDGQTINKTTPHIPLTDIENLAKQVSGGNHCLCASPVVPVCRDGAKTVRPGCPNSPKKAHFPLAQVILREIWQIS